MDSIDTVPAERLACITSIMQQLLKINAKGHFGIFPMAASFDHAEDLLCGLEVGDSLVIDSIDTQFQSLWEFRRDSTQIRIARLGECYFKMNITSSDGRNENRRYGAQTSVEEFVELLGDESPSGKVYTLRRRSQP